jgi:hypothetical protein
MLAQNYVAQAKNIPHVKSLETREQVTYMLACAKRSVQFGADRCHMWSGLLQQLDRP